MDDLPDTRQDSPNPSNEITQSTPIDNYAQKHFSRRHFVGGGIVLAGASLLTSVMDKLSSKPKARIKQIDDPGRSESSQMTQPLSEHPPTPVEQPVTPKPQTKPDTVQLPKNPSEVEVSKLDRWTLEEKTVYEAQDPSGEGRRQFLNMYRRTVHDAVVEASRYMKIPYDKELEYTLLGIVYAESRGDMLALSDKVSDPSFSTPEAKVAFKIENHEGRDTGLSQLTQDTIAQALKYMLQNNIPLDKLLHVSSFRSIIVPKDEDFTDFAQQLAAKMTFHEKVDPENNLRLAAFNLLYLQGLTKNTKWSEAGNNWGVGPVYEVISLVAEKHYHIPKKEIDEKFKNIGESGYSYFIRTLNLDPNQLRSLDLFNSYWKTKDPIEIKRKYVARVEAAKELFKAA